VRIQTQLGVCSLIGIGRTQRVIVDKCHQAETLGNLAGSEFILVTIQEASAACDRAVVANAIAFESDIRVPDDRRELLEVERRIGAVDTGRARSLLDLKEFSFHRICHHPANPCIVCI
jgi:hypothetical protein